MISNHDEIRFQHSLLLYLKLLKDNHSIMEIETCPLFIPKISAVDYWNLQ